MSLTISYVRRLEDVVEPAREFLSRECDLFAKPRIVVPTAGAKAWLWSQLAQTLGASRGGADGDGESLRDGIVANVEISYPGAILALLQPPRGGESDPWGFDRLTFTVLDVITGPEAKGLGIPFDVSREPLLAARRIAGLFDEYHVRRPGMIARWEDGRSHLSPVATGDRSKDEEWAADPLVTTDEWQFRTWRAVRQRIDVSSPATRMHLEKNASREAVLVAGLQSLSLRQITALRKVAESCEVRVLLVHPTPALRARWASTTPPESLAVPPPRPAIELPDDLDPLVATWLHGARETQTLLASQGCNPEHLAVPPASSESIASAPLLSRLQRSITTAVKPVLQPHDLGTDPSVTIHRCHTLSRQAEVLHDALLHAFHDLDNLQPHEVVIVSPCLEQLAPHLEAVFAREIVGRDDRKVKLPLIVADRGLHELSDAAGLLIAVMRLVGSRCSVEDFRAVAEHALVKQHFGIDDNMVRRWEKLIERTGIHWGFDAVHRSRETFPREATEPHTWQAGLERMLLGAVLPAGKHDPAAGTIPLEHVPLSALGAIETLARIHEVIRSLDDACHGEESHRAAARWCDAIEETLLALCGPDVGDLAEPLRAVRRLRDAASPTPVPFHDVRTILEETLQAVVGRQPLRTGAITATSMVALRDVPFRVVCVAGYDDRAVTIGESQGDDLVSRQPLAGDGDPRIDSRRALLDCVLTASERLLVTCTGMDIRTNKALPLVTPLSELVDFAVRHGVGPAAGDHPSGIEIRHARHAIGRRNFMPGGVLPGRCWSHDKAAMTASQALDAEGLRQSTHASTLPELPAIELSLLESMIRDPLNLYLKKSLGIDTWREDEGFPAATFPLGLSKKQSRELAASLFRYRIHDGGTATDWIRATRASGQIPFGRYGEEAIWEIVSLVDGIISLAQDGNKPVPLKGLVSKPVHVVLPGRLLTGSLTDYHEAQGSDEADLLVDVRFTTGDRDSSGRPLHVAALRLLAAWASGWQPARAIVISRHEKWKAPTFTGPAAIIRTVELAKELRTNDAAAARLAEICNLVPLALAAPCSRFGGLTASIVAKLAANDAAAARKEFAGYLAYTYPGSNEEMVYGHTPRFDDIFVAEAPELTFHAAFERLFPITGRYTLS